MSCQRRRRVPARLAGYKGNLHTHTLNSDGDSTPDEVVRWYREHGYDFLVLTDHNFVTEVDGLNAVQGAPGKFLVVRGEEVTSRVERQADSRQRSRPPPPGQSARRFNRRDDGSGDGGWDSRGERRAERESSELRLGDFR